MERYVYKRIQKAQMAKKENLRDNMTNTELVLNMLAEVATTNISIVRQPSGFEESARVAKEGAKTAKAAREQLEKSTGTPAISSLNAKELGKREIVASGDRIEVKEEADDKEGK
jgi:hypothetical protein